MRGKGFLKKIRKNIPSGLGNVHNSSTQYEFLLVWGPVLSNVVASSHVLLLKLSCRLVSQVCVCLCVYACVYTSITYVQYLHVPSGQIMDSTDKEPLQTENCAVVSEVPLS